jgi:recombination protein RecA
MAAKISALRTEVERALAGRHLSPFEYRDRKIADTVSAGIAEIDDLTGGLPRGGLTEICGPPCSGRTSLLLAALASRTVEGEVCALVDGRDAFDPYSAETAGVDLANLLWVRCHSIDQSLRATDLLLQSGGFGLIVLDLSDIPAETVRHVPLNTWFRFRRAVEDTPTIFLLLAQESNAKTCASLVLHMEAESAKWSPSGEICTCPTTRLLDGFETRAEIVRSRMKDSVAGNVMRFPGSSFLPDAAGRAGNFSARAEWGYLSGIPIWAQMERLQKFKRWKGCA